MTDGVCLDPPFHPLNNVYFSSGGTIGNADLLAALDACRLQSVSPLAGTGLDLSAVRRFLGD